jgi:hypothetical protein
VEGAGSNNIGVLSTLPAELAYLAQPAMRFGIYQFEDHVGAFLSAASNEDMEELARLAERVKFNDHFTLVNDWLDRYEMTEYREAANLYFLFGVMDAADLEFI